MGSILLYSITNAQTLKLPLKGIDIHDNRVLARMYNRGGMFYEPWYKNIFHVPFRGDSSSFGIYTSNLLISSRNDTGHVRLAGLAYSHSFQPGPLPNPVLPASEEMKQDFNKIWTASEAIILDHLSDYNEDGKVDVRRNEIYAWPGKANPHFKSYNGFDLPSPAMELAPFYDKDGNDIYDPDHGDYPHPRQVAAGKGVAGIYYTVFHHDAPGFRVEVHQTAWTFDCQERSYLNNSLFTAYRIRNAGTDRWFAPNIALYWDPRMGCNIDDAVGSIPDLNASYVYNLDSYDGFPGFEHWDCDDNFRIIGIPPVQSVVLLGRKMDVLAAASWDQETLPRFWLPETVEENDHILNARWRDGAPMINPLTGTPAPFVYPDHPAQPDGWSILAKGGLSSVGLFQVVHAEDIPPGAYTDFDLAYVNHHHADSGFIGQINLAYSELKQIKIDFDRRFENVCNSSLCREDCIWPGDTNGDGRVSELDAIPILRMLAEQGPKRQGAWSWRGRKANDWISNIPAGKNTKYADADGDGVIGTKDLQVVDHYFGYSHGDQPIDPLYCQSGTDLFWQRITSDSILRNFLAFRLMLKSDPKPFRGISFRIKIDTSIISSLTYNKANLWKDTGILDYYYPFPDKGTSPLFAMGLLKQNPTDEIPNSSLVGSFRFFRKSGINALPDFTELEVCEAYLHRQDGTKIPLDAQNLRIPLKATTAVADYPNFKPCFYPNPCSDILYLSQPELVEKLILFNLNGKKENEWSSEDLWEGMETEMLSPGLYFIQVIHKDRSSNIQKINIVR